MKKFKMIPSCIASLLITTILSSCYLSMFPFFNQESETESISEEKNMV